MRGLNSLISPLSYYSVAVAILTQFTHVRRLVLNLVTGKRLVAGICIKGVTRLTRLVMERGFMGLEWGLEGLVPNNCVMVLHGRLCSSIWIDVTGFTKVIFYVNMRSAQNTLCTSMLPRTQIVQLGTCALSRIQKLQWTYQKSLPCKSSWFCFYWMQTWSVIQSSVKPLHWNTIETKLIAQFKLGTDFNISFVRVPIDALVHLLCVFPDCGGEPDTYFAVILKKWNCYFGNKINKINVSLYTSNLNLSAIQLVITKQ